MCHQIGPIHKGQKVIDHRIKDGLTFQHGIGNAMHRRGTGVHWTHGIDKRHIFAPGGQKVDQFHRADLHQTMPL
ncbi:hypothetical protein JCM17845_22270 [Iodidimonas gelatinilytica]|uniref:Uncharacterized protein n=1 Tax=Iodidimonas gelatinilytica TaxID=1236966 RepID=A0A5A7N1P4_9PROT|nr:hypothetical protein JCM17845_22270 [Iodidimonas gelatinilytica]